MRNLITILLLFTTAVVQAQVKYSIDNTFRKIVSNIEVTGGIGLPRTCGAPTTSPKSLDKPKGGYISIDSCNGIVYLWIGNAWQSASGSGGITTESDPVWSAAANNYYSKTQSDGRYLQSFSESDPLWNIQKNDYFTKTQSDGRYLQSFVESDPSWAAAASNYFTKAQSDSRYLQSFTESDPTWAIASSNYFTKTQSDLRYLQSYSESDPIWNAQKANYLTASAAASTYATIAETQSKITSMSVVGDLLNLSSIPAGAERNYFTTSGSASIATSSNELVLNGIATVATTNIVNVPIDMASERWTQKIRIRCNVTTGTQRVGLGTRPSNRAGINRGFSYTFDAGSGVDKGKGFVFTGNGGTFTQRTVSAALPLSNNDVVELTVERNGYTFNCKSKNITTGDSVTISYEYPITSTSEPVMLPTSRPAIYQLNQANQTLLSWSFVDQTPTNPYLLIIGDSKSAGHNATAASGRFVSQLQSSHPDSVVAFTGYGDELNDAVKWLHLIKRVKPKNVVIALGSNDVRNSQTEISIAENLSRIIEACKFINAEVYFLGMGENTINQSYLWHFANASIGSSNTIITYPALAGDGVHLANTAAHTTVAQAINSKLF